MTTPDYNVISDTEIAPGKPITSSLFTRLRDNVLSIIGGGLNAPSIARNAISAGGSSADGAWGNSTTLSGLGFFEPSTITRTTSWSLPGVVVARCNGDVAISAALTLGGIGAADAQRVNARLGGYVGAAGADAAGSAGGTVGGAGANLGAAGDGVALGIDVTGLRWPWNRIRPWCGGHGGGLPDVVGAPVGADGGGSFILLVEGNVDCTGGTVKCNGGVGVDQAGTTGTGAGAGGSIIIIATGTITAGTYEAKGGAGAPSELAHGGGGGYVGLIASAFAGSRTKTVTGGAGTNGGTAGGNGYAEEVTLTAAQIRSLLFRSY